MKNVVLFLGAGFSRAFGLPVMDEFFSSAKNNSEVREEQKVSLRDLQKLSSISQGMVEGDDNNLEHVLSVARMSSLLGDSDQYGNLAEILRIVYGRPAELPKQEELTLPMERILGFDGSTMPDRWLSDHKLTIITTNYDVIAEFALYCLGMPAKLDFSWTSLRDSGSSGCLYRGQTGFPVIHKLHGSLNWFAGTENGEVRVEDSVVELANHRRDSRRVWPKVGTANFASPSTPMLMLPTYFKERRHSAFDKMWDSARDAMKTADRLLFIGYSFPESDTHMKYFIGGAIAGQVDLDSIDIIDPNASEIVQKLKKENSGFGSMFLRKLKAHDGKWQETDFHI